MEALAASAVILTWVLLAFEVELFGDNDESGLDDPGVGIEP